MMESRPHGTIGYGFGGHIRMEDVTHELKVPSESPLSYHWSFEKNGVLNVVRLPDFEPVGYAGLTEDGLLALVVGER